MKKVTQEDIRRAKSIGVLEYFRRFEPNELIKVSNKDYRTKSHDSLVVSENGLFHWCSMGVGGNNAIDYLLKVKGMDFISAVRLLNEQCGLPLPSFQPAPTPAKESDPAREFRLPAPDKNAETVEGYLKRRSICSRVIRYCLQNGSSTEQTLRTAVQEIEAKYRGQLTDIRAATPHDVLEETGTDPSWPEVLALYAVKTTTDPTDPEEVTTMTDRKKAILRDIFWQMHTISHTTETRTTTNYIPSTDAAGNTTYVPVSVTQQVLVVNVKHKSADEMASAFGFTPARRLQLTELLSADLQVFLKQENMERYSMITDNILLNHSKKIKCHILSLISIYTFRAGFDKVFSRNCAVLRGKRRIVL